MVPTVYSLNVSVCIAVDNDHIFVTLSHSGGSGQRSRRWYVDAWMEGVDLLHEGRGPSLGAMARQPPLSSVRRSSFKGRG